MLDAGDDRIERDLILATLGDDEIGVSLRRLDELLVHRTHRRHVLIDDRIERATARLNVANETAHETNVGRRVDEQLDVDPLAELRLGQNQNPFDDQHAPRLDALRRRLARMCREVVERNFDRRTFREHIEMSHEQLGLERIGMIEVDFLSLFGRERVEVAIVRIVRDPFDAIFSDAIVDRLRDCRFARAGAAGDADDDRLQLTPPLGTPPR